jgi:hypothetical protein
VAVNRTRGGGEPSQEEPRRCTRLLLLVGLASDLAAIVLLAYAVYFRRSQRRDLLLAYVALNLGVLAATDPQARREVTCSLFGSKRRRPEASTGRRTSQSRWWLKMFIVNMRIGPVSNPALSRSRD